MYFFIESGNRNAVKPLTQTEEEEVWSAALNNRDEEKCILCQKNPKNATVIHGMTGHTCCCLDCAKTLKEKSDPCPLCQRELLYSVLFRVICWIEF